MQRSVLRLQAFDRDELFAIDRRKEANAGVDGAILDARLAFGGMAATPSRARHAEAALTGRPWSQQTIAEAIAALARDFNPISDLRATSAYRLKVAGNLLHRFYAHYAPAASIAASGA